MFNNKLYNTKYHKCDISKFSYLITGGAGFVGSNIVEYLLKHGAGKVRVLDNLSNGYIENIESFLDLPNFEFINGDIRDFETCEISVLGIDYISHQAALGSVPRSINDPILTNDVNVSGFLNMLVAAKASSRLKKFIFAASSSTYGDSPELPKVEGVEGKPLSPYAVTKAVNEIYAEIFSPVYNFHTVGLRYFNIFGPKQNPNNPYAAVIPIFCRHFIESTSVTINGDGLTSRDFTFVENAVQANIKAFEYHSDQFQVFNVACGDQITLQDIFEILTEISSSQVGINYEVERKGDVKHSKASIKKVKDYLEYNPQILFREGLGIVYDWYKNNQNINKI